MCDLFCKLSWLMTIDLDTLDVMYLKYLTLLLYLAVSIAKGDKSRGSLVRRRGFFRTMQHTRENLCSSKGGLQCKCLAR